VQLNTNDIKKLYCPGIRASLENMAYLPLVLLCPLKLDRPYFQAEDSMSWWSGTTLHLRNLAFGIFYNLHTLSFEGLI
jgi:hypothetical protein